MSTQRPHSSKRTGKETANNIIMGLTQSAGTGNIGWIGDIFITPLQHSPAYTIAATIPG
jgi:hypothetical protein